MATIKYDSICTCHICHQKQPTRYIDIYHMGSEGCRVCKQCDIMLGELVRQLTYEEMGDRKASVLKVIADRKAARLKEAA